MDGRIPANGEISKRSTEGLRIYRMVEESDVIALTFSDFLSENDRKAAETNIRKVNDECETFSVRRRTGTAASPN